MRSRKKGKKLLEVIIIRIFSGILPKKKTKKQKKTKTKQNSGERGGLVVSALDSGSRGLGSSPGRIIVLCSWAKHFTLTVPLSTQEYKWVQANMLGRG